MKGKLGALLFFGSIQNYFDWSALSYDNRDFYCNGSALFQDPSAMAPKHRAWQLTERFNEYENDVHHMLWCSQSSDLNLKIKHL